MCTGIDVRRSSVLLLGVLAGTMLLAMTSVQDSDRGTAELCKRKMLKIKDMVGSSDLKMQVDMAAVGQPGAVFNLSGTGESMFVLDGTGWLNVSEVDRTQAVDYIGYRTDLNQYFLVNMSPDRTALSYMAGDFVKNDGTGSLSIFGEKSREHLETAEGAGFLLFRNHGDFGADFLAS